MLRFMKTRRLLLLASLVVWTGCGQSGGVSSSADPEEIFRQSRMSELGEILSINKAETKAPPKAVADLTRYQGGWPAGYAAVKDGSVVVIWGVGVQDGVSDKIIAHDKEAADSGGYVLMQDGKTVKKLSADQFKAASKASNS